MAVNAPMAVRVDGLRRLRSTLLKTDRDVLLELRAVTAYAARIVAEDASRRAVRRTGRYADSIKPQVRGATAAVRSPLPQANVLHWGGTIRPRGVPIHFPRRPVIYEAADAKHAAVVAALATGFEAVKRRNGW